LAGLGWDLIGVPDVGDHIEDITEPLGEPGNGTTMSDVLDLVPIGALGLDPDRMRPDCGGAGVGCDAVGVAEATNAVQACSGQ
jgi:hypothetical protein